MGYSTILDYNDQRNMEIDKRVLFSIVKRENLFSMSKKDFEIYKKAAVFVINSATIEQLDSAMKDVRADDAVGLGFYGMITKFYSEGLIDKERFVTIMQEINYDKNIDCSQLEYCWIRAIEDIPHKLEEKGIIVMRAIFDSVMPKDERKLKSLLSSICVYRKYWPLFMEYYPELTIKCIVEREESDRRFIEKELEKDYQEDF